MLGTGLGVRRGDASIVDVEVHGFYGAGAEGGSLTVRRSLIEGSQWGLVVIPGFNLVCEATVYRQRRPVRRNASLVTEDRQ